MSDKEELERMKKALEEIVASADHAMETPRVPATYLLSFRWFKKLAERGLGKSDD